MKNTIIGWLNNVSSTWNEWESNPIGVAKDPRMKEKNQLNLLEILWESPEIEYRHYGWTWELFDDILSHNSELEKLRSWTNVDWINSRFRSQELIKQWMDVWFVWKNPNYVISNIDSEDKYSEWYNNCTWIVLLWKDENWRHISMLSHQNPLYFLSDKNFENDMIEKIRRFVKICKDWNIDVFIVGWNVWTSEKNQTHIDSVRYLSKIIQKELKKEPKVLNPNNDNWSVTIKVETQQNRIIILQPKQK